MGLDEYFTSIQGNESYLLGELLGIALIIYVIYWIIKKMITSRNNRQLTRTEKITLIVTSIIIYFGILLIRILI